MDVHTIIFTLILSLITPSPYISRFCHLSAADVPGNETDKRALHAFKSLITEDPLLALASWNDSSHFCTWNGVQCDLKTSRLTGLSLSGLNLAGTITPLVGNLSFINVLDLSDNSFNGQIPSGVLGQLSRLKVLNVSYNLLHGRFPGDLWNCSSLTNLAMDHNYLIGNLPSELGSLTKLLTLYLGNNNLTGTLPSSLENLTSLVELDISYNFIHGQVPNTLSKLKTLGTFRLSVNSLSGEFPAPLYNLTSLEFIALSFNNLTGNLRNDIGVVLPNVRRLWLASNFFTGSLPNSFPNATKLESIYLTRNIFTGKVPLNLAKLDLVALSLGFNNLGLGKQDDLEFVTFLTNCSNLRFLDFGNNQLAGAFPASIANLSTKLSTLYLQSNFMHGSIPKEISSLQNLDTIFCSSNNLNGPIPDAFSMLPKLAKLVLGSNKFTGRIPPTFGNITSLLWLVLSDNMLEGPIPPSLANCKQMVFFNVAQNNLTGIIPIEVITEPSLLAFNLSHNSLTGPLPDGIGNSSHLVAIDLSFNKFFGEISDNIGSCLSMNMICLQGNLFEGRIPDLARLSSLNYLDLSSNNLSGKIPSFLTRISSFVYLNLSCNNLEGEVPLAGVFSNTSAIDVRANSKLCGGAPGLHLPACPDQDKQKKQPWKLILITVLSVSLPLFLLLIWWKRMKLKTKANVEHESSGLFNFFPKISYSQLLKATNGFSSQNLIGSGSFGRVYRGTLASDGSAVAVKVMRLDQKGAATSFMSECQALRNIRHHNLVKVITACSSTDFRGNEFKAVVYEFMPNGSLDKWLHPEEDHYKLSILQRIDVAIDIAAALHYLHHQCQTPVIHCDVKPQNVLLDSDMIARVSDFGLARLVDTFGKEQNVDHFGSLGGVKGTIGYAAPEQGMGAPVTVQGDVYSYGILLLEIFTGKKPTDNLFTDNMSLHTFVQLCMPAEVLDDSALHQVVTGNAETWNVAWTSLRDEHRHCLIRILRIGLACSSQSPGERLSMQQVHQQLLMIKDTFLDAG